MKHFISGILILFTLCCALSATAQEGPLFSKPYTPSFAQGSVKKYIKDIEDKADVHISFSASYVDLKQNAKLPATATTVYYALQEILSGQNLQLQESGDKILIVSPDHKVTGNASGYITINGFVKDLTSREVLIGAVVYIPELNIGTTTNSYGFYSLSFPAKECRILCSYLGYGTDTFNIKNHETARRDILLSIKTKLEEVKIVSEKETSPDHQHLTYTDIKSRPVVLGENDVMRALQFVAGVQSGTDGTNAIMVRGGDPGQNLNLLDGVPLYYVDHFFGLTSVYNSEAIKSVDFHKGAFPSRYGGRLSSVIDVNTKDGDMQRIGGQFTMGLVKGSLNLEGPIIKDKASIMLSARRTWLDLLWRPFTKDLVVNFYDVNGKANYIINKNNRIYLSFYNGNDGIGINIMDNGTSAKWGNTVSSLKWNTIVNPKLFVNNIVTYSRFRYLLEDRNQIIYQNKVSDDGLYKGSSSIQDLAYSLRANWSATAYQHIEFGFHYSRTKFIPVEITGGNSFLLGTGTLVQTDKFQSNEFVFFAEDEVKINDRWTIRPGIHFANWISTRYNYSSIQPRFYTSYKLNPNHSLYLSYSQMAQFLHLISNTTFGLPTDFWIPSSSNVEPEESTLYTAGYAGKQGNVFSYNIEGYYKDIRHTTTYGMGKNLFDNSVRWDEKLIQGKGWSYGGEATAKIKLGPVTFATAYTLSWTWRKFEQLNEGKAFPYRFDRRHNIKATFLYQPSERFDASFSWTYMSGEAITLPDQIYQDFDQNLLISPGTATRNTDYTYNFVKWNNYRLPAIHRLDIGFNFIKKKRKHVERTWSIGVFNAYGRKNVMYVDIVNDDNTGDFKLRGMSFLQYIPYVSYTIRF